MTAVAMNPLEAILRLIAQAEPQSWYPRSYAEASGVPLDSIHYYLEHLYLDGLVVKGETSPDGAPGVVLTLKGKELLEDAEGLERLRQGLALDPRDRGGIVRELLRRRTPPVVTRLLILANLLVFGYGIYLAWPNLVRPFLSAFLQMDMRLLPIFEKSGVLRIADLTRGDWSRLLTSCFVHFGVIHLLCNMYGLWIVGKTVEQMWGRLRYLVIYFLSGLGGNCLAVLMIVTHAKNANVMVIPMGGASGALCGILGAEITWILLNRKYLPRDVVRGWMGSFIGTGMILVFLSLYPGVGGWAHLGGGLTGVLVACLLNWHRFGPDPWRWLGVLALLPLPWVGYLMINQARQSPFWNRGKAGEVQKQEAREEEDFRVRCVRPLRQTMKEVIHDYDDLVKPQVQKHWQRRTEEEVTRALETLTRLKALLGKLEKSFSQAGPYADEAVEEARQKGLSYTRTRMRLLDLAERCLREKDRFTRQDDKILEEQENSVARLKSEWEALFD